jgi:translation elongation factor EF-4
MLLTTCCFHPESSLNGLQVDELYAGEVGYFSAAIKQVADARVGDTITSRKNSAVEALPGCGPMLMLMLTCAPSCTSDAIPDIRDRQRYCCRYACPESRRCLSQFNVGTQELC